MPDGTTLQSVVAPIEWADARLPSAMFADIQALDAVIKSMRDGTYVAPSKEEFARSQLRLAKGSLDSLRRMREFNARVWGASTDGAFAALILGFVASRRRLAADALAARELRKAGV